MINKEQLKNGLVKYIDNNVLPALPSSKKWIVGTSVILFSNKFDEVYLRIIQNSIVDVLGVKSGTDNIDDAVLFSALEDYIDKYGKISIELPLIGIFNFSKDDLNIVHDMIIGGNND